MESSLSSWFTALLLVTTVLLSYLYILSTSNFDYWKKRGVKFIKPLPILGNSINLFLRKNTAVYEQNKIYTAFPGEKFVGYFTFSQPTLMVRDPSIAADILTKITHFTDRDKPMDEKLHPLANNLASLTGTRWKSLRKKLAPVFTPSKLKTMLDEMFNCAEDLSSFLEESLAAGDVVDVFDGMSRLSMNVIGSIAFGLQLNSLQDPNSEFITRGKQAFHASHKRNIALMLNMISPKILKLFFKTKTKSIADFFVGVIKETVSYREDNNVQRNDYLQLLINLKKEDAKKTGQLEEGQILLDDNVMAANVFIFFLAGFETTAVTLGNCLFELAANPEVQNKLRDEILSSMKNHETLSYEVINDMKYLEKVLSETLRKYSIAMSVNRQCTQRYTIPGTDIVLDEGVKVDIPSYSIQRDPQYYPDPERFDPERFSEENKMNILNGTYIPFGDGPRICFGLRFALLEMKVALIHMLPRFQFSMSDKMTYPMEFSKNTIHLAPKDGVWLKLTKIDH